MTVPRIRKSVADLTTADLEQYPVWEFALDEEGEEGQDETTVRPYLAPYGGTSETGMYVVRAAFRFRDGSTASGYLTPPTSADRGLSTTQPVVITPHGQVIFWWGMIAPTPEHLAEQYRRLAKSRSEVFPIQFWPAIPLTADASGEIPGFLVVTDLATLRTRIER